MTREELEEFLTKKGFEKDRYGHYKKFVNMFNSRTGEKERRLVRYKLQAHSVRKELQIQNETSPYSNSKNRWIRLQSSYYKDLTTDEDGKLLGLKR